MRLWVDVTDATGARLGVGPVRAATSATVQRRLDGIGSWQLGLPAGNARAVDLLTVGRYVAIYADIRGVVRRLGGGQIVDHNTQVSASGELIQVTGPDDLRDLKRASCLIGRRYDDQAISVIVDDLAGLAGWTASTETGLGSTTITAEGVSALKALQDLAEQQGLHLRLGDESQVIEFGAFGDDIGLRLVQRESLGYDAYANTGIAFIQSIKRGISRSDLLNWLLPLGNKDGDPRVTLEYSTRTAPYTIQSMTGPSGSTLYYLTDAASIATYGAHQDVKAYSSIEAASSDPADLENAANALYDAAAADLVAASVYQDSFSLSLVGVTQTIRPGDQVRVVYHGEVESTDGGSVTFLSIDDLFWVIDVSETIGSEGHTVEINVSNVDRRAATAAQTVAKTVAKVSALEV